MTMQREENFNNQVVVVTGASSGIGRAIALAVSGRDPLAIVLIGRDEHRLDKVARLARQDTENIICIAVDLTKDSEIQRIAKRIEDDFGRINVLIHSAGIISLGKIESAPIEALDQQYRTNVRVPFLLTKTVLPMLIRNKGQVVFINSSAGMSAKADVSQYAATKFALRAVSDSLREEVNAHGVRVMTVYPGQTHTPMQAAIHESSNMTYRPERLLQPDDVASMVIHALRLPRTAEVTDIHIRPMNKSCATNPK